MLNQHYIAQLEQELEIARKDALPQIVETVKDTKDEKIQVNKTSGTVRRDILDGPETQRPMEAPKEKYVDLTVYFPETVSPEVGKIVKEDEKGRDIELKHGGTRRTDFK